MAKIFENMYGSNKAIRRNATILVASSLFCYVLAAILFVKGGWRPALPLLLIPAVVDALCLVVWLSLRSGRKRTSQSL